MNRSKSSKKWINLTAVSPAPLERARALLREHQKKAQILKQLYNLTEGQERKLDKDTLEQLKTLGYVK